jgi:hypothetical protein
MRRNLSSEGVQRFSAASVAIHITVRSAAGLVRKLSLVC